MTRRVLVLPSPPTANGDLHVGHLAGPYLGADVFARYRRMCGYDVALVTGADVHQSYVVSAAERLATTPQAAADRFSDRIEDTLRMAGVRVDAFMRPHRSQSYRDLVRAFFRRLIDGGFVSDDIRPVLWCPHCRRHLLGAAVRGLCGNCGCDSDGALCESCGRPVDPPSLIDPVCARCLTPASLEPLRRLFFSVGRLGPQLRDYYSEARTSGRPKQVVDAMLDEGLFEAAVTSPGEWGIEAPAAFAEQRLDVWAEVGPGYLASTQALAGSRGGGDSDYWRGYWCSPETEIVQFFGFDNTVPHTLLYPALYLAHGGIRPPSRFVINEFHRLEGEKFSTSRRHAVWGGDILGRVPSDCLRYHLCLTAPEREPGNFTVAGFVENTNEDLCGSIGPLVEEMVAAARGEAYGDLDCTDAVPDVVRRAEEMGRFLEPETFSLRRAAASWLSLVYEAAADVVRVADDPRHASTGCPRYRHLRSLSLVASCAYPLMPSFAQRLWTAIGAKGDLTTQPWAEPARAFGGRVERSREPWFARLDRARLEDLAGDVVVS